MDTETRLSDIRSRLQGVKNTSGGGFLAICPAHTDTGPSLSVGIGQSGRVLLKCFAGCDVGSIMNAIDLPMTMLFDDEHCMAGSSSPKNMPQRTTTTEDEQAIESAQKLYRRGLRVTGNPGGAYLESRGIPAALADVNHVRYIPRFPAKIDDKNIQAPAVVFPIFSPSTREVVGINARFLDPEHDTNGEKQRTRGRPSQGVFAVHGAVKLPELVITEAPIDALSLAVAGFPAFATCGANNLRYFPELYAGKIIVCAFDLDSDPKTQEVIRRNMEKFHAHHGGRVIWIKPPGAKLKDWNDMLQRFGHDGLAEYFRKAGAKCSPPIFGIKAETCSDSFKRKDESEKPDKTRHSPEDHQEDVSALSAWILKTLSARATPIRIDSGTMVIDVQKYAKREAESAHCRSPMIRNAARGRLSRLGITVES